MSQKQHPAVAVMLSRPNNKPVPAAPVKPNRLCSRHAAALRPNRRPVRPAAALKPSRQSAHPAAPVKPSQRPVLPAAALRPSPPPVHPAARRRPMASSRLTGFCGAVVRRSCWVTQTSAHPSCGGRDIAVADNAGGGQCADGSSVLP